METQEHVQTEREGGCMLSNVLRSFLPLLFFVLLCRSLVSFLVRKYQSFNSYVLANLELRRRRGLCQEPTPAHAPSSPSLLSMGVSKPPESPLPHTQKEGPLRPPPPLETSQGETQVVPSHCHLIGPLSP